MEPAPWRAAELCATLRDAASAADELRAGNGAVSAAVVGRVNFALNALARELPALAGTAIGAPPIRTLASQLQYCKPPLGATIKHVASTVAATRDPQLATARTAVKHLLVDDLSAAAKRLVDEAPDQACDLLRAIRAAADEFTTAPDLDAVFIKNAWSNCLAVLKSAAPLNSVTAAFADELAHALAAHVETHAAQCLCTAGEAAKERALKLCGFFASTALQLVAAHPGIGVREWDALICAGVVVRTASWSTPDLALQTSLEEARRRCDACLYRALEAESVVGSNDGSHQCAALLERLCDIEQYRQCASLADALLRSCGRLAVYCDAVLAREGAWTQQQAAVLTPLAIRYLDWAMIVAHQNTPLLLRFPPPVGGGVRGALTRGLTCAMVAAARVGGESWQLAEQHLVAQSLSAHPVARHIILGAWTQLVARAPPQLARQHVHMLLSMAHAVLEQAAPSPDEADAACRLCHAAGRLLEASWQQGDAGLLTELCGRHYMPSSGTTLSLTALVLLYAGPLPLQYVKLCGANISGHIEGGALQRSLTAQMSEAGSDAFRITQVARAIHAVVHATRDWGVGREQELGKVCCQAALTALSRCGCSRTGSTAMHAWSLQACDACCALLASLCPRVDNNTALCCASAVLEHAQAGCVGARNAVPGLLSATSTTPGMGLPEARIDAQLFAVAFKQCSAWPQCLDAMQHFVQRCRTEADGAKTLALLIPADAVAGGREAVKAMAKQPLMPDWRQNCLTSIEWPAANEGETEALENDAVALNQAAQM